MDAAAMIPSKTVIITVGSHHDLPTSAKLTPRILENCPQLARLPPGSSLPSIHPKPLQIVLAHLDGDDALSVFTIYLESNIFLLRFAETWALVAQLCPPVLQNKLVMFMRDVYIHHTEHGSKRQYPPNQYLLDAFKHLRKEVGPNSHAENFLICFVGRTAPLICELERQLYKGRLDKHVKEKILAEARSFERNPIKHRPNRFLISLWNAPEYPTLEVYLAQLPGGQPQDHDRPRPNDIRSNEQGIVAAMPVLLGPDHNPQGQWFILHGESPVPPGPETGVCGVRWPRSDGSRDTPVLPGAYPPSDSSSEGPDVGQRDTSRPQQPQQPNENTPLDRGRRHDGPPPRPPPQSSSQPSSPQQQGSNVRPPLDHGRRNNVPPPPPHLGPRQQGDSSPPPRPPPPPPRPQAPNEHDPKSPYIINFSPHTTLNNNANGNGNAHGNGAAVVQGNSEEAGSEKGRGRRHRDRKKGKRFAWFSLLTCGIHNY